MRWALRTVAYRAATWHVVPWGARWHSTGTWEGDGFPSPQRAMRSSRDLVLIASQRECTRASIASSSLLRFAASAVQTYL
jgi:hypothetical protein